MFVGVGLGSCLLLAIAQQAAPLLTQPSPCPPPSQSAKGKCIGVRRAAGLPQLFCRPAAPPAAHRPRTGLLMALSSWGGVPA